MKLYDASIVIIICILAVSAIATGVSYKYLGSDSVVTQDAEKILETEGEILIKKETGIDIPLTPQSQGQNAVQK